MQLTGIHHVTAVTGDAPGNVDFYTRVLGLRLVKKTVNQDDVSAYHLFYGDYKGSPGTEMTFFDWPQSPPNRPGPGSIAGTAFRVRDGESLKWWIERFRSEDVEHSDITDWRGREAVLFTDREQQQLALVAAAETTVESTPWADSPVPAEHFITGFDSVSIAVKRLDPTERLLTNVLGFRRSREYALDGGEQRVIVFEMGEGGSGSELHVIEQPNTLHGRLGTGGVHHVAFRTPNAKEQEQWHKTISQAGVGISQIIDRYYFQSIYFREPGGTLFEIATDGPGFATDEDVEHLGERLALPPFLEPYRERIEAGLQPLDTARQ